MDTGAPKDFFISYTRADQRWAEWIAWHLEAAGYQTIIQAWDFLTGSNFVLEMDAAARQATRTIAVLSPDYFASQFTPSEWAAAFKRDPTGEQGLLISVRVRPCDVEGLLGQIVYIDLVDKDESAARTTLLHKVKHERDKPSSPPAFPFTPHQSQPLEHPTFPGALPAVWNIPYPRNPYFTGREELLRRLAASPRAGATVGIPQPQAVHGLGGVGKTQIALEYAYRYYQDYEAVLWTRADTQEALISGFVVFAALLGLPEQEERDQLKSVQAVKHWLTSHTRWLLLLDNADDLALVRDFLPPAGRGHSLLTTRASSMGRLAHAIEVDTLDSEPGALLLLRRTERLAPDAPLEQAEASERTIALTISQELGGLPLALDQAGAYIEETQCSLADYLQLYRSQRAELLNARGGLVPDHPEPVATTWSLSFAQVQAVLKDGMDKSTSYQWAERVVQAVDQTLPAEVDYGPSSRYERCLPHAKECTQLIDQEQLTSYAARWLPHKIGRYLWQHARYAEAEAFYQHSLRIMELALGPDHPDMAFPLIGLAVLYSEQGKYAEAEPLYQRALRIWEQALGPDHPLTREVVGNYARLLRKMGREAEANELEARFPSSS